MSNETHTLIHQLRGLVNELDEAVHRPPARFDEAASGRNADLIARYAATAKLVSRLQFNTVYSFDSRNISLGSLRREDNGTPMGLIELYYLLDNPDVRGYVYDKDEKAIVVVEGEYEGHAVSTQIPFSRASDVELIKQCKQPSVHLLRRLQIAGAR